MLSVVLNYIMVHSFLQYCPLIEDELPRCVIPIKSQRLVMISGIYLVFLVQDRDFASNAVDTRYAVECLMARNLLCLLCSFYL